nr:Ig-like domain-containing protein [Actinomycetota bacterium]
MFRRHRLALAVSAVACLLGASAASADPVNTFTAAGSPSLVQPTTSSSYTILLTNDSLSPARAQRAKIGIPSGFTVDPLSVQATTTAVASSCDASIWEADGTLIADQKIHLKRPAGDSSSLCPGASLNVVFLAVSAATDGTYVWASELLDDLTSFTLSGSDPTVVVDGTAPDAAITQKPSDPSKESSPSFSFTASETGSTFACKLDTGAFADCTSPTSYADLADGSHTFTVKATDAAGNTGLETTYSWTID